MASLKQIKQERIIYNWNGRVVWVTTMASCIVGVHLKIQETVSGNVGRGTRSLPGNKYFTVHSFMVL